MKKPILLIIVVLIVAALWLFSRENGIVGTDSTSTASSSSAVSSGVNDSETSTDTQSSLSNSGENPYSAEGLVDLDERPAAEIYKTAEDALKAVQSGASDYDDIILEQFTEPGEDCSWCDSFYASITDMMKSPDADEDQRAYFSEILAISGRVENIKILIESIEEAGDTEEGDIYAESLELTIGGDGVVKLLSTHLESKNELLQESVVAAITNQGSKLAAETLYDHTLQVGDEDGYYSLGIGLAELIPEEGTLPYLQELVMKRDNYSHLALKSLLNYGHDGLVIVMDTLINSQTPEKDKKMLEDAIDHVAYEEETEAYLKKLTESSKQGLVGDFAKEILEDFDIEEEDEDIDEEEEIL